ncbi:DUF6602 domain-containing protein [Petroclostridium sp. X23]|uniref:DUF6602 domain-containing protein n=1 Tax=Petroclostridium sp. X23 TaxID=3045146 RepID=UPI0024AE2ED5|nr:DUF6602 domain-containing protein [Petroclostridium sp. X23]WHH59784.1 hypothetical protein QKW49_03235 [Petroclostridium sp. X23]
MRKIQLKELFYDLQTQMIAKLSTNRRSIAHPGAKGDASELNWIQWLKDYLPKRYCVDKAFIIDCDNNISDQIDVVIYDQQYTPFAFKQDSVIYIPAESVYAIFEVKQELSKEYIEYAGKKAESVRSLRRTSAPIPYAGGFYPPKPHNNIISGILTLTSTWTEPLGKSFEEHITSLPDIQRIDIGCALQCGSFKVDYNVNPIAIEKSTQEESFIYFFLKLLMELQKLATIPAMDIECYARALDSI